MADDKSKRGPADRRKVAGGETYEKKYFASKTGLSSAQVQDLIDKVGNSRDKLTAAAARLKKKR